MASVFLAEFYTKHPKTREEGWDIQFAWIIAPDAGIARELVKRNIPDFECIITIGEHSEITALTANVVFLVASEFHTRIKL